MSIEPIKIPQNVYIEDRIVGPLTLKQIIIVALGGGFSYALFESISKSYGIVALPVEILVWVPGVISIIFAFVKINDLSMMRLCLLFIERLNKPSTRTFTTPSKQQTASSTGTLDLQKRKRIEELTTVLDQPLQTEYNPDNDFGPAAETPESAAADVSQEQYQPVRKPVNPLRISATPLTENTIDTVATTGSVSVFKDVSKATHD